MVNIYVDGFPNCIANQLTGFYMRVTLASKEKRQEACHVKCQQKHGFRSL